MGHINGIFNNDIMGKVHSITAIIAGCFIISLLFLIIHPFDIRNQGVEDIYHSNEGLIWVIGLAIGIAIAVMTYINGVFQSELKACALINKEKNAQIVIQNKEIISNQKKSLEAQQDYIAIVSKLNDTINKNSVRDLETVALLQKIERRVDANENKIKRLEKLSA